MNKELMKYMSKNFLDMTSGIIALLSMEGAYLNHIKAEWLLS